MKKSTSYKKLITKIILLTLSITLAVAFIYGEYLKKDAIEKLTKVDAKKTSELIFQTFYSAMEKGWTRNDLENIVERINKIDNKMKVDIYRSPLVAKQFGEIPKDTLAIQNNTYIKKALQKEEILNIHDDVQIEYFYPVIAQNKCLTCHFMAKKGDVLGVIDISYPVEDLKVSLTSMFNLFVIFIIVFSLILFISLSLKLNKYLIKPIKTFIHRINDITQNKDIKQRVEIDEQIDELTSMQDVFNGMLDALEYQFYNDELTLLPNRKKLIESLYNKKYATLMLINLDKFQEINDLYGDKIGNELLIHLANILKEYKPKNAVLYKMHADEYCLYYENDLDIEGLKSLALYLIESIEKNGFVIKNGPSEHEILINASIGIAIGKESLLTNADIALKIAKRKRQKYVIYDSSMKIEHEYEQNLRWGKKIKDAIRNDRVVPLFQPIVDVKTKEILKYESLIRIIDNKGDYISPIHFLDLAKKNKLYTQLTKIVIKKSLEKFKNRKEKVSINLSVEDILNKDVYNFIIEQLQNFNIGEKVVFELLESEGIENFEEVLEFIKEVKSYGCQISIDDFGTGYSNFEYLMKLKVDYIKIDASMIKNIDTNTNSQLVTQTIIEFANRMKIETIGEFVHSKNVYIKVKELGIHYAQGYYFGEPQELKD